MSLDAKLVDVRRLCRVKGGQREVVDYEEVHSDELAHLDFVARVKAGRLESLVELVGPFEVHADAPAAGDVPEGSGQECLSHSDGPQDEGVAGLVDEAHRDEL